MWTRETNEDSYIHLIYFEDDHVAHIRYKLPNNNGWWRSATYSLNPSGSGELIVQGFNIKINVSGENQNSTLSLKGDDFSLDLEPHPDKDEALEYYPLPPN